MFDRLEDTVNRYEDITAELGNPDVVNDQEKFRKLMKEQSSLAPLIETYTEYKNCKKNIEDSLAILDEETDEELKEMAKEELNESKARVEEYAQSRGWKVEVLSGDETGIGGMKEVEFMVKGQGAYSIMKYESGVHRVQRIPVTESNGRIQTSTASVAVMPEAEEVDIHIDEKDIRIDVMRASGNGGQCVNTTDSAVRLTHYPTGIVIYSQTEKSQIQNKEKAFALLRAKLYDIETQKAHDAEADARRSQIGTGDRAEKIRTYNFPQGRVTDHRIGLTLYKLDKIMDGDIQDIIDACIAADQAAKLAKMGED